MKRLLSVLICMALIISAVPMALTVTAETGGDYTYTVLDDGTAEITGYTGGGGAVNIPSTLGGYTVTSIGYEAFYGCTSLTSITIPNSVTSIGRYAFEDCTSLTSITIPNSVTSIGSWAFSGCTSLTEINVDSENSNYSSENGVLFNKDKTELIQYPIGKTANTYSIANSVTSIGDSAFEDCTSLTSITIPNSVTSIGDSAFEDCTSLTSITIPNSVTSIGGSAFEDCTSLTSITIPNSVTSIGFWAFSGCTSLTSITIPNSVTSIGDSAFYACTSLTEINVDSENSDYSSENGVLFNKDKTELIQYPIGKTANTYSIPNSVTSIGGSAFEDCTSLTSITIPNSVTSIGFWAFYGCTSLTEINVDSENSDYSSENGVLFNKDKTELIQYPIGKTANTYSIPNSVTSIGWDAFSGCTSLTTITIPNSVTSIGDYAFYGCTSLTSITIPNSVTSIGYEAFGYFYDDYSEILNKIPNFTIYGEKGSAAEKYATDNGFEFVEIGGVETGDVNGDGEVNLADVRVMITDIASGAALSDIKAADINGDGEVNLADIRLLITQIAAG